MEYQSTRDANVRAASMETILRGIAPDGGLFVPCGLPALGEKDFSALGGMDYEGRAAYILKLFLTDFTEQSLQDCVRRAYGGGRFETVHPAPLRRLDDVTYMLELWHGPTCAFKDMALQILPHLLCEAKNRLSSGAGQEPYTTVILVATSGDTGKAALEGFRDVPGTRVIVFYPEDGVSAMQKAQMVTQEGGNVHVCAIRGNFDDAQQSVKSVFTDDQMGQALERARMNFSSANSINWGRLVPQIVYYVSAYVDLLQSRALRPGDTFNVAVPTGNFGNILAAYYAKSMGVPIHKLICASNQNNVLTDFIRTGVYDRTRAFYTTLSPSMDILISSNLERLLYALSGSAQTVSGWMGELRETGRYEVDAATKAALGTLFYGGFCDDTDTLATMGAIFRERRYLCDTHTAVAARVYQQYKQESGDGRVTVIVSTASPFKFPRAALQALGDTSDIDDFAALGRLSAITGIHVPGPLASLEQKPVRFTETCTGETMSDYILRALEI